MSVSIGLVEDSDVDFAVLRRVVDRSSEDIEIERWARAEDLLQEARAVPARTAWPDLMFIDLNLPGIDGAALVTELRALLPTRPLPLFILSGSTREKDVDRCYSAGASLYLVKPLNATHIKAAVDLLEASPGHAGRRRP